MNWLYIFLGGGLGAVCRWGTSQLFSNSTSGFPFSTFLVNMLGCLLIGIFSYFITEQGSKMQLFLLVGFLGGFTTFSAYGFELFQLMESGNWRMFAAYFVLSNLFGLLFVILGHRLSSLILNV